MFYYSNKARETHIKEITRLINMIGEERELTHIDLCHIVDYLLELRNAISLEINPKEKL